MGAAVASVEVIIKNAKAGEGHTDAVHKIRFNSKTRALEVLCKHLGKRSPNVLVTQLQSACDNCEPENRLT